MNKMTLEEFIRIRERMAEIFNTNIDESELTEDQLLEEYLKLLDTLLSHDLSDIPFEEWKGMYIFREGELDFSKTHANLDFSLLEEIEYERINLNGCNVRNIQRLHYDETTFDQEFMASHPEFFPDASLPDEIRKAFYDRNLRLHHLIEFPSLRKCVSEYSFEGERYSGNPSNELISLIGLDNTLRLLDEYPKLILNITEESEERYISSNFRFNNPEFKGVPSYEEAKKYVFGEVVHNLRTMYSYQYNPEILPQELIDMFPQTFIGQDVLPERTLKSYYESSLSLGEVRYYYDILKNCDLDFGIKKSSECLRILKYFGSFEDYFAKVPKEMDHFIATYLNSTYDSDQLDEVFNTKPIDEIIKIAMRKSLGEYGFYFYLDEVPSMLQYISLDEIVGDEKVIKFIEEVGLDLLIEFNKAHNFLLEEGTSYGRNPFNDTFLQLIARHMDVVQFGPINNMEDLKNYIGKVIEEVNRNDDYHWKAILDHAEKDLAPLYPQFFFDKDKIKELIGEIDERELDNLIDDLKRGLTGYLGRIPEILKQYPQLIEVLESKQLIINSNYPGLKLLLEALPKRKFLELISKYGMEVDRFFFDRNSLFDDELLEIVKNSDDYEAAINERIYRSMFIGEAKQKKFDIRELPASFREQHPELFLPEDAPSDLQYEFYGRNIIGRYTFMSCSEIQEHPEWIPYLLNVNLAAVFENINVNVVNTEHTDPRGISAIFVGNLFETLKSIGFSNEEILTFLADYGKVIARSSVSGIIDIAAGKEGAMKVLIDSIVHNISNRKVFYDEQMLPEEFKHDYPEFFLSEDAPDDLRNLFYQRKLSLVIIQDHPEWIPYLEKVDISIGFNADRNWINNFSFLSKREVLELFYKFGPYLALCEVVFPQGAKMTFDEAVEDIKQQMVRALKNKHIHYNEDLAEHIGDFAPEFFLSPDAPEELKECYYFESQKFLTFKILKEHRDWLPYLKGKVIRRAFVKGNYSRNLINFFEKYGDEEALRIGLKNPEAVSVMLQTKPDLLYAWWERLRFIPHHVVMLNFPVEEIDKYVASGKKWSMIMRLDSFTGSDEDVLSLLKASYAFGVFDGDDDGFHDFMQLFSDVPRVVTQEQMENIEASWCVAVPNDGMSEAEIAALEKATEDGNKKVELIRECYQLNDRGQYVLIIDPQREKEKIRQLRKALEDVSWGCVLTPNRAHQIFGGFELISKPDFRRFLMEHIDEVLASDELMPYISKMHKQWEEIKAINSNRVLTLELALAYVKSNVYEGVQIGNVALSEVSKVAGYSQDAFDRLQQIFNYGKVRTYSSIPRIKTVQDGYTYEILKLDDPLAVAIGTLTDCCQELGNAAESSMKHSMTSRHGRVFVIKDSDGNIVAQSWMWRNKNVICFDNIEIPDKAFTRASREGMNANQFAEVVYNLYKAAADEIIAKDEEVYKQLLEEGKITEEQYEALRVRKVTVGEGYNDIKSALIKNAPKDQSEHVARPIHHVDPVDHDDYLYTSDSSTQYILSGEQDVPESTEETLVVHGDEFDVLDDKSMKLQDVLSLIKLEIATKGERFEGNTQVEDSLDDFVTEMAWNYGLNPTQTRVISNPNFAIIYADAGDKIILGDLLYNFKLDLRDNVDVAAKIIIQIRRALDQIGKGKEFDISRLDEEQRKVFESATKLDKEMDEERGLSHGTI
jgi:hypothetical protein